MKLLVTGGAGFIGSEFVRQGCERGYKIVLIDKITYSGDIERIKIVKKKITFYQVDITNKKKMYKIFEKEKPESVIHLSAESHVDRSIINPAPFLDTNIKGTQILLDCAKENNIKRFLNISTDEVYGELIAKKKLFYETTPLIPSSPYSVSKAGADMLGRSYYRTYNLPVITLRPSNNYGHWQYPEKFIPIIIIKALNNEKIPIYNKGQNIREWLFVSDCVNAIFDVLEKGQSGEVYNIGSGEWKKNIEVAEFILKLIKKPLSLIQYVKDRPGHDFRYSMNSDKIKNELNWTPKVSFKNGIEKTIKWYIDNQQWTKTKLSYLKKYWKQVYKV